MKIELHLLQDGASSHFSRKFRHALIAKFPN
jgi:hypothetical protein